MKIVSSRKLTDPRTLAPVVELVIQIPIETLIAERTSSENKFASVVGEQFISAWNVWNYNKPNGGLI